MGPNIDRKTRILYNPITMGILKRKGKFLKKPKDMTEIKQLKNKN